MKTKFLLIHGSRACCWLKVLEEALAPFGTLEIAPEADAIGPIVDGHYDLIIVSTASVEDVPLLITQVRERRPHTRFVVATASPTWSEAREVFRAGALDYIHKSMNTQTLRSTFDQILAQISSSSACTHLMQEATTAKTTLLLADNDSDFLTVSTVTCFIEELGLRVITLPKHPGAAGPSIAQAENYANVGFVVVLLTPDDGGGAQDSTEKVRRPARQNALFELEGIIDQLGRRKVAVLYKEGVEIPADYQGVRCLPMEPGNEWRLSLAREMKHAGIDVDPSEVIQGVKAMSPRCVLFADNDPLFLKTRAEFLKKHYHVREADTIQQAEQILRDDWVHLAILDIRMVNDREPRDVSGLALAKDKAYRPVPKIILTGFQDQEQSYEHVREALAHAPEELPPAVEFLAKKEGPEALLRTVEEVFAAYVRINWDLVIQLNERNRITFSYLVSLIETGLEDERLSSRARELEDLVRRLFNKESQISIDRLLWQREGRVALTVFAFKEGAAPESFVVVCGQRTAGVEEARRYKEFAPKAPGAPGTALSREAETTHFAANAYALAGADLSDVHTLADLYRTSPERGLKIALEGLFRQTLTAWHQERRIRDDSKTLDKSYRERLAWTAERIPRTAFEERVQALVNQILILGPSAECANGTLTLRFNWESFSYPDPTSTLYQTSNIGRPVLLMKTPGLLSGDNILADTSGRTWLTDFASAGLAPLLWNFVTIEAAIRFDWIETSTFQALHDMERCLVAGAFNKLDTSTVERPLRRAVRAIQAVRRLAAQAVGVDSRPYALGLLFHAASRLVDFYPAFQLPRHKLVRLAHILVAAAMICSKIEPGVGGDPTPRGIWIDTANRVVWVNGTRTSLSPLSYALLCYLYERANQLCTPRELVEQVWKEKYDETDDKSQESQINCLHQAIYRLRDKIEDEPDHPRYLRAEPGGYRLVPQP